jgi:hypothetical protein
MGEGRRLGVGLGVEAHHHDQQQKRHKDDDCRDDDQDGVIQPLQIAGNLGSGGLVFGASGHRRAHGFQGLSQSDTRQQKTKTGRGKPVERGHKTHVFFPFSGRLFCRLFDHAQASGRIPLFLPAVKPY